MMNERSYIKAGVPDWRWQAVRSKDGKFDGAFYFGVRTTGIFCRPSCSSKTPKRENVSYFADPAAAEAAGFRPCLRCKPKNNYFPGATAEIIARAFRLLRSDELEVPSVDELAKTLGISPGHLQKTFRAV